MSWELLWSVGVAACRFSKYWHALQLNKLGYTVLFLDDDVVALQDPFKFHDRQFDIEG